MVAVKQRLLVYPRHWSALVDRWTIWSDERS